VETKVKMPRANSVKVGNVEDRRGRLLRLRGSQGNRQGSIRLVFLYLLLVGCNIEKSPFECRRVCLYWK
jgi:hypothetical protein